MWEIPSDVITKVDEEEDMRTKSRRFFFIARDKLLVINKEGIEKMVNIEDNFADEASMVIPYFEKAGEEK